MKLGIIHYNFPDHSLSEFLRAIKKIGYGYSEIGVRNVWGEGVDDPEKQAEALRKELDEVGIQCSAVSAGNDFVLLDDDLIEKQVKRMERICGIATILGTNVLRTEGGQPKESVPEEKWAEAMTKCLKRMADFVEKEDYYLAVDNHGHVTNDGELQVKVFDAVGSKHIGANLDTMNYRWKGHDLETVYKFWEMVAPYTFHTHFKDGVGSQKEYRGTELGSGELDLPKAVAALKKAGYDGVWTVEYEKKDGDREEGARKSLEYLKSIL